MHSDRPKGDDLVYDDMTVDQEKLITARKIIEKQKRLLARYGKLFDLVFLQSNSPYSKEAQELRAEILKQRKGL